jgi:hypothetical protein
MRVFNALRFAICLLGVALFAHSSHAQSTGCDEIARDVAVAIQKDPSKALMIVEDALVINESCACEIIKAAIVATNADSALVNQIVQTGIAVAPKMSGVIMDCATSVSGGSPTAVESASVNPTASGKNPDKNPLPIEPAPASEDYALSPSIRGVYLIQPPASGLLPREPKPRKCNNIPTSPCQCTP